MFNFRETNFVPGFRVRDPKENVPGFRVAPDGLVRGSATDLFSYESIDPTRGSWLSDHFLNANDRFAGNPYLGSGLASQPGEVAQYLSNQNSDWNYPSQISAGNEPDTAWAKCHARCAEQTVGRGLPDSFTAYRRCMRACLNSMGTFDY
jgi:hypothetical protein